jgi:hypothetical protein
MIFTCGRRISSAPLSLLHWMLVRGLSDTI